MRPQASLFPDTRIQQEDEDSIEELRQEDEDYWKEIRNSPIEKLYIYKRSINSLKLNGIKTVGQFAACHMVDKGRHLCHPDGRRIREFGREAVQSSRRHLLLQFGLMFANEELVYPYSPRQATRLSEEIAQRRTRGNGGDPSSPIQPLERNRNPPNIRR
jgi:hypothetical protein